MYSFAIAPNQAFDLCFESFPHNDANPDVLPSHGQCMHQWRHAECLQRISITRSHKVDLLQGAFCVRRAHTPFTTSYKVWQTINTVWSSPAKKCHRLSSFERNMRAIPNAKLMNGLWPSSRQILHDRLHANCIRCHENTTGSKISNKLWIINELNSHLHNGTICNATVPVRT